MYAKRIIDVPTSDTNWPNQINRNVFPRRKSPTCLSMVVLIVQTGIENGCGHWCARSRPRAAISIDITQTGAQVSWKKLNGLQSARTRGSDGGSESRLTP